MARCSTVSPRLQADESRRRARSPAFAQLLNEVPVLGKNRVRGHRRQVQRVELVAVHLAGVWKELARGIPGRDACRPRRRDGSHRTVNDCAERPLATGPLSHR